MTPETAHEVAKSQLVAYLSERVPELVSSVLPEVQAELPAYGPLSPDSFALVATAIVERLIEALRAGRPLTEQDLAAFTEFGESRARLGISLLDIQRVRMLMIRPFTAALRAAPAELRTDRAVLAVIDDILDLSSQAELAYSAGHREVEVAMARRTGGFRADFTRNLLLGTTDDPHLHLHAQELGVNTELEYRAFRTRREPSHRLPAVGHEFFTTIDGETAGFVEKSKAYDDSTLVAYGPPVPLTELPRSFRLAGRVLTTAELFHLTGSVDLDRLGALPAVAADPDLGAEFAQRYLAPLGTGEAATVLIETVDCFFESGMRIETTAEKLVVHTNTVRYRLGRFAELTGTDLRVAHTAVQVWWAIRYRQSRDGR